MESQKLTIPVSSYEVQMSHPKPENGDKCKGPKRGDEDSPASLDVCKPGQMRLNARQSAWRHGLGGFLYMGTRKWLKVCEIFVLF